MTLDEKKLLDALEDHTDRLKMLEDWRDDDLPEDFEKLKNKLNDLEEISNIFKTNGKTNYQSQSLVFLGKDETVSIFRDSETLYEFDNIVVECVRCGKPVSDIEIIKKVDPEKIVLLATSKIQNLETFNIVFGLNNKLGENKEKIIKKEIDLFNEKFNLSKNGENIIKKLKGDYNSTPVPKFDFMKSDDINLTVKTFNKEINLLMEFKLVGIKKNNFGKHFIFLTPRGLEYEP